jgi:hypothetical protein
VRVRSGLAGYAVWPAALHLQQSWKEPAVTTTAPSPSLTIWPGQPYPLGATYDGVGVNFAIFSEVAERIEL